MTYDQAVTAAPRLLITAGPTQEPIDAVRFIGNRSSGQLGIALAEESARRNWRVTLLLGPTPLTPTEPLVDLRRFRTTDDLAALLRAAAPGHDALVMAAAVADYRPLAHHPGTDGAPAPLRHKIPRRAAGDALRLELEPTPDLLAECAAMPTGQRPRFIMGFALEPRERLLESARAKLARKRIDAIVANPLETMDAPDIEAVIIGADGSTRGTNGPISKHAFAILLCDLLAAAMAAIHPAAPPSGAGAPAP